MNVRSRWYVLLWILALALTGCAKGTSAGTSPSEVSLTAFWAYSVSLEQSWVMDLDTGSLGATPSSDLWFEGVGGSERYLSPMNGTRMALAGTTAPGLNGCVAATVSFSKIPISSLTAGRYVCAYTNLYHWAEVRIDEAAPEYVPGSGGGPSLKMTVTMY
jgi:hypothetical protein